MSSPIETLEVTADIIDFRVIGVASFSNLAEIILERWGKLPDRWALPAFTASGPCFSNTLGAEVVPVKCWDGADRTLLDLISEIPKGCVDRNLSLVVDMRLPFINLDTIHIEDISTDQSGQACVCNPAVQEIISALITDAIKGIDRITAGGHLVSDIVLDCVDLWPMGASDEKIELTCFCQHCETKLASAGVDIEAFRRFPNPWNLCLRDSGTGVAHIDTVPTKDNEPAVEGLLRLSKMKGFLDVFRDSSSAQQKTLAKHLVRYVVARDRMTRAALAGIVQAIRKQCPEIHATVLVEGSDYDWTSGMFLSELDQDENFDELWFDPSSPRSMTSRRKNRMYMWRRSRYVLDAFFEYLDKSTDLFSRMSTGIANLAGADVTKMLEARRRQAMGHQIRGKVALMALPRDANRIGICVPAVSDAILEQVVHRAVPEHGLQTAQDLRVPRSSDRDA